MCCISEYLCLSTVALFQWHYSIVIFITCYEIKSLSPQKKNELSCPVRCYTVLVAYITPLKRRNYEHTTGQYNKSTVPINHITVLRVLAGKDLHEGMILILFKSSFHI